MRGIERVSPGGEIEIRSLPLTSFIGFFSSSFSLTINKSDGVSSSSKFKISRSFLSKKCISVLLVTLKSEYESGSDNENAELFYEYSILKEEMNDKKEAKEWADKAYELYKNADVELELTGKILSNYEKYQDMQ